MNSTNSQELKKKREDGETCTIVDTRSTEMYVHNHIPAAVNVPMGDNLEKDAQDTLKDLDQCVVVYGRNEEFGSGDDAAKKLEAMVYKNVYILEGDLMGWMEAGYQLEFGRES